MFFLKEVRKCDASPLLILIVLWLSFSHKVKFPQPIFVLTGVVPHLTVNQIRLFGLRPDLKKTDIISVTMKFGHDPISTSEVFYIL